MTKIKNVKLYENYAELMLEIKRLEARRDELKEKMIGEFNKEGLLKVELPLGNNTYTFSLAETRSWKYSKKVVEMQEKVKLAQIGEQERGVAKATVSQTIRFVAPKE